MGKQRLEAAKMPILIFVEKAGPAVSLLCTRMKKKELG